MKNPADMKRQKSVKIHVNSMICSIDKPYFDRYNISSVDRRL